MRIRSANPAKIASASRAPTLRGAPWIVDQLRTFRVVQQPPSWDVHPAGQSFREPMELNRTVELPIDGALDHAAPEAPARRHADRRPARLGPVHGKMPVGVPGDRKSTPLNSRH